MKGPGPMRLPYSELEAIFGATAFAATRNAKTTKVPLPMHSRSKREQLKRFTPHHEHGTTYFPPDQRGGGKERARRLKQLLRDQARTEK